MPIKLPKSFPRRKSSTNILEDFSSPSEPSFRVLERPSDAPKAVDDAEVLRRSTLMRPLSAGQLQQGEHLQAQQARQRRPSRSNLQNRGSGGTNNSRSSGGHGEISSASASARFSSSSTLPSSTDGHVEERSPSGPDKGRTGSVPPESIGISSLKAAGRAFSFGRKKNDPLTAPQRPSLSHASSEGPSFARERAMTESSYASEATAKPPRFFDTALDLGDHDDFGNMFDNFGEPPRLLTERSQSLVDIPKAMASGSTSRRTSKAFPYKSDSYADPDPLSPKSWASQDSQEGLMDAETHPMERSFSYEDDSRVWNDAPSPSLGLGPTDSPARRNISPRPMLDDDALLVRNSVYEGRKEDSPRTALLSSARRTPSPFVPPEMQKKASTHIKWQDASAPAELFDPPTLVEPPSRPRTSNKIMTPAQFERYRKEQEMEQSLQKQTDDDDANSDNGDDEDEAERTRSLARQRRKQEAHLSVYRQQMQKVTGDDSRTSSPVQLKTRASVLSLNVHSDEEEDEDVPLGVLAAHGFPSKTRPPNATDARIQYKSETYPPPLAGSQAERASGLPAFAKKLPQDPYYGASIVNPASRESFALGYGGPASPTGGVPAGGLVNVIAGEERARAVRRGSPNPPQGGFGNSGMTAGEQATVQMSEQMNQMMQMQMQWMQQMQQMMAQGMSQGMMPPQMMAPPPMMAQSPSTLGPGMIPATGMAPIPEMAPRPMSFGPPIPSINAPRTMSMVNAHEAMPSSRSRRSMASSGILEGSASIAPSERSTVGQPGRYRPVSMAGADESRSRAQSLTLRPQTHGRHDSDHRKSQLSATSSASNPPIAATPPKVTDDNEDDDDAWNQMRLKRERKRSMWRLTRHKDVEAAPSKLEYYDYQATD